MTTSNESTETRSQDVLKTGQSSPSASVTAPKEKTEEATTVATTTGSVEDTTASASSAAVGDVHVTGDHDDDDDDDPALQEPQSMPLLKYSRITGSLLPRILPRTIPGQATVLHGPLSVTCTSSAMTRILLDPLSLSLSGTSTTSSATTMAAAAAASSSSTHWTASTGILQQGGDNNHTMANHHDGQFLLTSDLWKQPHHILALGWETGQITLIHAQTGIPALTSSPNLRDGTTSNTTTTTTATATTTGSAASTSTPANNPPIVDLSWDASGTILAAVDAGGTCAIWEWKYAPSLEPARLSTVPPPPQQQQQQQTQRATPSTTSTSTPSSTTTELNMFTSFMSALTGMPPTATQTTTTTTASSSASASASASSTANTMTMTPCIKATTVQVSRVTYPQSFGRPTCIAMDPAQKRKREKSLVVGFADGRLMFTKRGFFQRRTDAVIYQGQGTTTTTTTTAAAATTTTSTNTSHGPTKQQPGSIDTATAASPPPPPSSSYRGIETIAWRGSLLAWADANGIKLMDVETLTRIAHIDRPTGARPTLYPTISSLRPSILFETSSQLLVAWGDCLMTMTIREKSVMPSTSSTLTSSASASSPSAAGGGDGSIMPTTTTTTTTTTNAATSLAPPSVTRRRTVECTMAWELDCVACGVVPLDEDHVVILGLVPPSDNDHEDEDHNNNNNNNNNNRQETIKDTEDHLPTDLRHGPNDQMGNDLEVQIVSRRNGTVRYCDSLPLLKHQHQKQPTPHGGKTTTTSRIMAESASSYHLLSSFALARMEDVYEAEEARAWTIATTGEDFDRPGSSLFAAPASALSTATGSTDHTNKKTTFQDPHLSWTLQSILLDDEDDNDNDGNGEEKEEDDDDDNNDDDRNNHDNRRSTNETNLSDTQSIDSDDYDFVLDPIVEVDFPPWQSSSSPSPSSLNMPPVMVVTSGSDLVLATMATVDDAIEHALARRKCGLALRRALRHKRQLRRFDLNELVNNYMQAVLRLFPEDNDLDENEDDERSLSQSQPKRPLSLRRMKLAIESMPVLFGGDVLLWERWAQALEDIPGALFLLRNSLPVRDPILPSELYERVLQKMMLEVEQMTMKSDDEPTSLELVEEAQGQFLNTLIAWGPTKVLKEYIKLFKFIRDRRRGDHSTSNIVLKSTEIALQRRYMQTAAGYLNFPVIHNNAQSETTTTVPKLEVFMDDSKDALYHVTFMLNLVAPRVPLVAMPDDSDTNAEDNLELTSGSSGAVAPNNRMCLDAMARLQMMQDRYDLALKSFLAIGAFHSPQSMEELEANAVDMVNGNVDRVPKGPIRIGSSSYEFVVGVIEFHHLHQLLLDKEFVLATDSKLFMPLFALLRLIGLDLMGEFLMEHCVSPEWTSSTEGNPHSDRGDADDTFGRRETLPMDRVAVQLEASPALLHWYLHLVFTRKPELYVKFPNTANPPKAVTDLHRKHFDLYMRYAGDYRNSAKALQGTDIYKVDAKPTPFLAFLKV